METLMNKHRIFASVGAALLCATVSLAQQIKTDYDHNVAFSQYKTYTWQKVQTNDPLLVDRIKGAVDKTLTAKGWTPVQSGGAVDILAMEMNQNHRSLSTYYDGFGGGWRWGGFGDITTTVTNYTVGTLVVDLFDANTKKLIWRGSSSETLSNKSDKNIKALNKDVQKMFDHFPPGGGK